MGAKLGKTKNVSISDKANGHEKEVITISNNHSNGTATVEKKIKKKKERISTKKSSDIKVDKYTSTEGSVVSSSTCIKQLVSGSECNNIQINSMNHSETPSKDVLELRDACIRRGIISSETNTVTLLTPIEQDQQENTTNTVEESTNETETITVVPNNEQVQDEQQVES